MASVAAVATQSQVSKYVPVASESALPSSQPDFDSSKETEETAPVFELSHVQKHCAAAYETHPACQDEPLLSQFTRSLVGTYSRFGDT